MIENTAFRSESWTTCISVKQVYFKHKQVIQEKAYEKNV